MADPITLVTSERKATEGVKAQLQRALAYADQEGCTGVAIAFVTADGGTATLMEPGENVATLIGAVQRINLRLLEHR
ncbi:hypothetical protein NKJ71_19515 [Mesorhizobium sp. M0050]|uniref:hypothetical protein n=1 Tax=Mesorhizobium sp. M0050 TaxID=2956861 RepID=UPI00333A2881